MKCQIKNCLNEATKEIRQALSEDEAIQPLEGSGLKINYDPRRKVCDEHYKSILENHSNYYSIEK